MKKEDKFWNRYAKFYDRTINKAINESYKKLYSKLKQDVCGSANLLEMATGTGEISIALSDCIQKIIAIDFAENMLDIAKIKADEKELKNIEFKLMDCCELNFKDKSFDTIICCNALHLMSNPNIAMQEMYRVLEDDGQIIVPTYCHGQSFKSKAFSNVMSFSGFKARSKWSSDTFVGFIKNSGFKVVDMQISDEIIPFAYVRAMKTSIRT